MKFHIRIRTERRISTPEAPRTLATIVKDTVFVSNGKVVNNIPQYDITVNPEQLYMLKDDEIESYDNILCVEELDKDGKWVNCVYGDNTGNRGWYMGWPLYRSEQEYVDGEEAKRVAAESAAAARQKAEDEARAKWEAEKALSNG